MRATTKLNELRARSPKELQDQLRATRQELFNLRFQMATGKLENHREIQHVRRDLARILGLLHERRLSGETIPEAPAVTEPARPARRRLTARLPGRKRKDSATSGEKA
jgi:large subunit ribosomal protein L29